MKQPITFKVTDDEKKKIESQAKKESLPTASFCRSFILKNLEEENKA